MAKFLSLLLAVLISSSLGATTLNVRDFGAKGDGVSDDTEAFNRLDAAIAGSSGPIEVVIPDGIYMVNPLKTPLRRMAPGVERRKCLLMLTQDHSSVRGSGIIKIMPGVDYTVGMKNGEEWYWAAVLIRANHCLVDGLNFSGNGTGTVRGHISSQKNLRWEGVSALGPLDGKGGYHVGNQVRNCRISGGGGQAIAMQHQKKALIVNNIVEDSTGMGFSRSDDSAVIGNISTNSHDAPYIANGNCNNILIANNISRKTTNGSGIDIVGCRNVLVQGNLIEDSAAWGILVGYSVQQKAGCSNVMICGNQFIRNGRSVETPMNGEIMIGRPWGVSPQPITGVTISGNRFEIDGGHGRDKGSFVSIGYNASDVQIVNNVIAGSVNADNVILTVWKPTEKLIVAGNVFSGSGTPGCRIPAGTALTFHNNLNFSEAVK